MSTNRYAFTALNKRELSLETDRAEIFFAMRKLSDEADMTISLSGVDELFPLLEEELYYVSNNLVSRKGKTITFRGELVLTERKHLISFLQGALASNDLRPMLISPFFVKDPQQVIFVTEDQCHVHSAPLGELS